MSSSCTDGLGGPHFAVYMTQKFSVSIVQILDQRLVTFMISRNRLT